MESKKPKKYIIRFNQNNHDSVYSFDTIKNGTKKVEKVKVFKSINDMLNIYNVKDIMPDRHSKNELLDAYYSFSGYKEKIKKFGIITLEI